LRAKQYLTAWSKVDLSFSQAINISKKHFFQGYEASIMGAKERKITDFRFAFCETLTASSG
jgi:hypothetical protein